MKYIFLTSIAPKEPVKLDIGTISKERRVGLASNNGTTYYDSLSLSTDEKQSESFFSDLRNWILFHSFTVNSLITLIRYQQEPFSKGDISIEGECADLHNYSDVSLYMYMARVVSEKGIFDYEELYKKYLRIDSLEKSIVKNYLTISELSNGTSTAKRQITDVSYWKIVGYYSIIEKLLGRQPYCIENHVCKYCHRKNIQHYQTTYSDWINSKMSELIENSATAKQYTDAIVSIYKAIRNPTAHESAFPSAEHIPQEPGTSMIYDLETSKKEFLENKTALLSLMVLTQEISRYLLLHRIYRIRNFPPLKPLVSTAVSMRGKL